MSQCPTLAFIIYYADQPFHFHIECWMGTHLSITLVGKDVGKV